MLIVSKAERAGSSKSVLVAAVILIGVSCGPKQPPPVPFDDTPDASTLLVQDPDDPGDVPAQRTQPE